jgi:hypothetical protein
MVQQVRRRGVIKQRANNAAASKWHDISKYFTDISMKWNDKFPGISQEELISRLVKTAQIQKETIENIVRLGLQKKGVDIQEKQLGIQEKQLDIHERQAEPKDLMKQCNSEPKEPLASDFPDIPSIRPTDEELELRLTKLGNRSNTYKTKRVSERAH